MRLRYRHIPTIIAGSSVLFSAACLEPTNVNQGDVQSPDGVDALLDTAGETTPDVPFEVDETFDIGHDGFNDAGTCDQPLTPAALVGTPCTGWNRALCAPDGGILAHCSSGATNWAAGEPDGGFEGCGCECYADVDACGIGEYSCCVIGYAGVSVAGRTFDGERPRLRAAA